jgi:hypothetical protein
MLRNGASLKVNFEVVKNCHMISQVKDQMTEISLSLLLSLTILENDTVF